MLAILTLSLTLAAFFLGWSPPFLGGILTVCGRRTRFYVKKEKGRNKGKKDHCVDCDQKLSRGRRVLSYAGVSIGYLLVGGDPDDFLNLSVLS